MNKQLRSGFMLVVLIFLQFNLVIVNAAATEWEIQEAMPTARHQMEAAVIDGKIYVAGGHSSSRSTALEMYDPELNQWETKANMNYARHGLNVLSYNGKLYAVGGDASVIEEYNPLSDTWTKIFDLPNTISRSGAAVVDGKIYMAGGGYSTTKLWAFDIATKTWEEKANMNTEHTECGMAAYGNQLYVFGGSGNTDNQVVEAYNISTDKWTIKANMPTGRRDFKAVTVGDKIYTVAGYNPTSQDTDIVEIYDPTNDTWSTGTPINQKRHASALAQVDGSVYVIGGYSGGNINTVERLKVIETEEPNTTIELSSAKDILKINEICTIDVTLKNAKDILAEDIQFNYDNEKFQFVGFEEVEGIKLYHSAVDEASGEIRTIIASQGNEHRAVGDTVLFRVKLKAVQTGQALVDSTRARIANVDEEWDLQEENCGDITITIEGYMDVNRTGEFTLVDLAIDAFYYNDYTSVDTNKYDADVVIDSSIDDLDLNAVVSEILNNTNYEPNSL